MSREPNTASLHLAPSGLDSLPRLRLFAGPTAVEDLPRLRAALGGGPRLLVKRDDAIPFACGGNKVRKLETVVAAARAEGADTLVTVGGVQSNHARVTAAVAARLGLRCVLVLNGTADTRPGGNHLLMRLLGAEIEYVPCREERAPRMAAVVDRLRDCGRRPYAIPLGASTACGAAGLALAVAEIQASGHTPDVIVLATSSAGTQAGVIAGCGGPGRKRGRSRRRDRAIDSRHPRRDAGADGHAMGVPLRLRRHLRAG
jgi:1-aminocyclopropane-1-carboxylate deaminase/D-cysteine desulfhydrase-like pyridoxal-dependent ACC family enzyme